MKDISIFLASSYKLSEERNRIEQLISRMNDDFVTQGFYLRLKIWEKLSSTFEAKRKQDTFNSEVSKSDIFLCLFHDKVGQFSKEEFDNAYKGLLEGKKPKKMYVFFNNAPIKSSEIPKNVDSDRIMELKTLIKKGGQIYSLYENIDELIGKVKSNLELDLPELLQKSIFDEMKSILNASNPDCIDFLENNKSINIFLTNREYESLNKIVTELETKKIIKFISNGNMMQNRPDGLMRTGFKVEKLENYQINKEK